MTTEKKETPILWGFDDQEILIHDNMEEAVEYWLEMIGEDDPLPETIKVNGYARDVVSDEFIEKRTSFLTDDIHERLLEEYGYEDAIDLDNDALADFEAAIKNLCKTFQVFQCHVVCSEVIDTREWVEENHPEWIAKKSVTWNS